MTSAPPSKPASVSRGRSLAQRLTPGSRQPALTALIAGCDCSEPVRAGLFLANGDLAQAHKVAQNIETPIGSHWHALMHRHEGDFDNSKWWLGKTGKSVVYPALAEAARAAGHEDVLNRGRWDPDRFTDAFADSAQDGWTRKLDALEQQLLLEHCLERES